MAAGRIGLVCAVVAGICIGTDAQEMFKASQCFKSRGIPKVSFECPPDHMVKIHRAFHGISNERTAAEKAEQCPKATPGMMESNCTQCEGDCIDDSMNLVYDWSTCMGNTSCIRTVMQSYMPSCPGRDKFSDYLQVEYQCVPRVEVIDICADIENTVKRGWLFSPNYPNNYPTNQDCLCRLHTEWESRIHLSLYDLLLETKSGRCRADWLMLRQKDQKHRHCGAIMTGTKNITSDSNSVEIQFHSDGNDNRTQNFQYFTRSLKGFWMYFTATPPTPVSVSCRRLTPADEEVKEIISDDEEFEEVVTKPDATTENPLEFTKESSDEPNELEIDMDTKAMETPPPKPNTTKKRPMTRGPKERPNAYKEGQQAGNIQDDMMMNESGSSMSTINAILFSLTSFIVASILH